MRILQDNLESLEGLELSGKLPAPAAKSLYTRGYRTLLDLADLTPVDFLLMPNVRLKDAEMIVKLTAEARSAAERSRSRGE